MERYYIERDTRYNSGLYHVRDSQHKNKFGEDSCELTYVTRVLAVQECSRLNEQNGDKRHARV